MFFEIEWVEVGDKHRPKNNPQMESKMECNLASIFETCQENVGAQLVSKVNPESSSAPKSSIIHPKIDFKRHQENDRFRDRFFLFPNSFFLFPNSFFLFPNSFFLFPNSFFLIPELISEFGNKAKGVRVQEQDQTSSGIRATSSGIRPNEFGNNAKRVRE